MTTTQSPRVSSCHPLQYALTLNAYVEHVVGLVQNAVMLHIDELPKEIAELIACFCTDWTCPTIYLSWLKTWLLDSWLCSSECTYFFNNTMGRFVHGRVVLRISDDLERIFLSLRTIVLRVHRSRMYETIEKLDYVPVRALVLRSPKLIELWDESRILLSICFDLEDVVQFITHTKCPLSLKRINENVVKKCFTDKTVFEYLSQC